MVPGSGVQPLSRREVCFCRQPGRKSWTNAPAGVGNQSCDNKKDRAERQRFQELKPTALLMRSDSLGKLGDCPNGQHTRAEATLGRGLLDRARDCISCPAVLEGAGFIHNSQE